MYDDILKHLAAHDQYTIDLIKSISANPSLDELTFKNIYLPMFYYHYKNDSLLKRMNNVKQYDSNTGVPYTEFTLWFNNVAPPTAPVDIVDVNGKILFTVPPFIDTSIYNKVRRREEEKKKEMNVVGMEEHDRPTYDILEEAQHKSKVMPKAGHVYMITMLQRKYNIDVDASEFYVSLLIQWNSIFTRYNLDPIIPEALKERMDLSESNKKEVEEPEADFSGEIDGLTLEDE